MKDSVRNSNAQPQAPARRRWSVPLLAALLLCILLPALPAFSQGRGRRPREVSRARNLRYRQELRQEANRHPGFFERLRDLPPKEQERVLRNNKRFQQLSPERQQRIRENLQRWDRLSPQQKAQIRRRERVYSRLSPDERQRVRGMAREWRDLRPAERFRVRMALRRMRGMTPEERRQFIASPQFRRRFSPREQNILRGLDRLFPGDRTPDR